MAVAATRAEPLTAAHDEGGKRAQERERRSPRRTREHSDATKKKRPTQPEQTLAEKRRGRYRREAKVKTRILEEKEKHATSTGGVAGGRA